MRAEREPATPARNLLATAPANVTIPAEVVYVVETGIAKSANPNKRREQLAKLLDIVTVLPFNV